MTGDIEGRHQIGDPSVAGEHGIRIDLEPGAQHEVALGGARMRQLSPARFCCNPA